MRRREIEAGNGSRGDVRAGAVRRLADAAADLLLGSRCPGCDRPGHGLCPACRVAVEAGRVHFAGRTPNPPGFPPTVSAGEYAGVVRKLVARYKDERLLGLGPVLAARLTWSVAHLLATLGRVGGTYRLVPVPSPAPVVRDRGLDHTLTLARRTARELRRGTALQLRVDRVLRAAGRGDQAGLTAAARLVNRVGQFTVAGRADAQAMVILIDDVTTTGATLASAATTLRAAGIPVLGAAVVAATVRRRPPRFPR